MVSGIVTAILLASFLAGSAWAWSGRRRADFERAARLPLEEPSNEVLEHSQAAVVETLRMGGAP